MWKVEGLERPEDAEALLGQARAGGRSRVTLMVLGRGADEAQVERWLSVAAGVPGYIGFAVGRTIWEASLRGYLEGRTDRADAVERIAAHYRRMVDVYRSA